MGAVCQSSASEVNRETFARRSVAVSLKRIICQGSLKPSIRANLRRAPSIVRASQASDGTGDTATLPHQANPRKHLHYATARTHTASEPASPSVRRCPCSPLKHRAHARFAALISLTKRNYCAQYCLHYEGERT